MKKKVIISLGMGLAAIGITAILSGCSQGYSSGAASTSPNPPQTAQVTQAPVAPTTVAPAAVTAGPTSKSSTKYSPKGFTPTASVSNVMLSMDTVAQNANGNFYVNKMPFMAYMLDGKYYVRANVCVPCGSQSFTLQNGKLICNSCGTVFNATTGAGMSGVSACMSYAKKPVVYTTDGGNLVMTLTDLTTAYQNTVNRRN